MYAVARLPTTVLESGAGLKIRLIKQIREDLRIGLKDAKDLTEQPFSVRENGFPELTRLLARWMERFPELEVHVWLRHERDAAAIAIDHMIHDRVERRDLDPANDPVLGEHPGATVQNLLVRVSKYEQAFEEYKRVTDERLELLHAAISVNEGEF